MAGYLPRVIRPGQLITHSWLNTEFGRIDSAIDSVANEQFADESISIRKFAVTKFVWPVTLRIGHPANTLFYLDGDVAGITEEHVIRVPFDCDIAGTAYLYADHVTGGTVTAAVKNYEQSETLCTGSLTAGSSSEDSQTISSGTNSKLKAGDKISLHVTVPASVTVDHYVCCTINCTERLLV